MTTPIPDVPDPYPGGGHDPTIAALAEVVEQLRADMRTALDNQAETNAGLAGAVRDLAGTMKHLHDDSQGLQGEMTRYREAFESVDRTTTKATVAAVLVGLVIAIGIVVSITVSRGNAQVLEAVRDCTQVGGRCYEDNQARSNERLGGFVTLICNATPPERRTPPCPPG